MCGIFGTVNNRANNFNSAMEKLEHRGPDGRGEWSSDDNRVYLGHRRLSIIDPEGGKQPLSNEDETIWITFNGCIYNYVELAQSLKERGHRFKTNSDTEVIIHAYEEYGEQCVNYFIGMFAFAIWDSKKQKLFCARDRLGIKPFYYSIVEDNFIFASEIKAILATGIVERKEDAESIHQYLVFQTIANDKTLFKNVKKLLPGHYMVLDKEANILEHKKYWDVEFNIDYSRSEEDFLEELNDLLHDAVKIRLRSDVPLGAHLSGGLDSSTVVSLASQYNRTGQPLKTFTGAFSEGEQFDETKYARIVAEKCQTNYMEVYPNEMDFIESLSKIAYFMDEPSAGPGVFPQYMVSKLAADNVKVALGGQGGDEIFGGYTRYLVGYLEECLKGAIYEKNSDLASIIPNLPALKQYVPMLKYFWAEGLFESEDKRYFRLMDRSGGIQNLYSTDVFKNNQTIFSEFQKVFNGSNSDSFLNKMLYFDLKVHLPALLHVEDRTSMAVGLESRVPLLDHRIVDLVAKIPPSIKFKNGEPKYLFKQTIKNIIPEEVLNRKDKMGFPVPLQKWYRNNVGDYVKEILLDKKAKERGIFNIKELEMKINNENDFGRAIWGALSLELWFKTHIDQ
ncbi:asparagine synthase (glutamine-hydrolyzing) [Schinkia azotoformans]|uniref:asparagine synthase (glutamine-hydrolyzing) n=1 Tax=Schinkia azotoformans TaxID=1454 RepID=UPI002DBC73FA|nr:asparagine synthase (glutamine-hydrolyzing) [Schinkia azotoformans]MEC1714818.1 asparagine synthase (glutamine-hydrolyzing) [Schinkia azotoformans]MEC1741724.1 asparagine synthase (glutamine-hydrolyzing) [Schinkia azotoformans]MEC1766598.1 asparagine synthase (glutamine-hydrolyzing) [Schinkia azotoformans]MEC1788013.1 asparagine synthase (glutamine-hydrolyzing) [Schinkia azotoformans]MED4375421.1 asparagine synthase (glutamine-hydrolyzing) [Schinkia azotoformans]